MKDDEAAVAALQKVFQDNLALTKRSKWLSIIGSVAAGVVVVVFSLIIFHQIRSFSVADLQSQLTHRGRPLLKSEFSTLGDQMTRRVYPLFKYELSARLKLEAPRFRPAGGEQPGGVVEQRY
ncbi:MAG: hypothetical protein GXP59_02385 [Deltaproteobacteria bacterium]|nr:hypothetical protein [Deltaproteobacteria bacterium]